MEIVSFLNCNTCIQLLSNLLEKKYMKKQIVSIKKSEIKEYFESKKKNYAKIGNM